MLTIKQVVCDIQKVGNILIPSSVLLALHEVCVFNSTMKDWTENQYLTLMVLWYLGLVWLEKWAWNEIRRLYCNMWEAKPRTL